MIAQLNPLYLKTRPWKVWSRLLGYTFFEGRPLTTRGQWINPIVFALFAILKKISIFRPVTNPIYILGTGRSGTTVLGIVLSMHRSLGFLNEPKALWHSVYAQEDLIGSYNRGPARYRLNAEDASEQHRNKIHRIYSAYLALTFSKRLLDKYPELIFRIPFVLKIFPDAKFIFLVRNGWDTCSSINLWSDRLGEKSGAEQHDWWGANNRKWNLLVEQLVPEHSDLAPYAKDMLTWTKQTDMAAVEWIITMREGLRLLPLFPNNILRVNYEELCANPQLKLPEITSFLNLEEDNLFTQYGIASLKSTNIKSSFKLNENIVQPFTSTMNSLGYHS